MTEVFEKQVAELNLDRSDWQLVKFGDVAIQQKKTVDRENTELNRYVKGEHMYSEDIHLREWGELTDEYLGPAFIRKFEEGDILYGSRRTYLRKVVIAPFNGITSNTTFVIKANEEIIDKRLLPFIMLSEGFSQHSIKHSKGSVNPYVNWKDLAGYEFLLPSKKQQEKICELFIAKDCYIESSKNLDNCVFLFSRLYIQEKINSLTKSRATKKLGELVEITTGKLDSNAAIEGGQYSFFTCDPKTLRIDDYSFDCEALLLAGNNASGIFPLKYFKGKFDAYQRTYVIRINTTAEIKYMYLFEVIRFQLDNLRRLSVGSSTKFLTMKILNDIEVPIANLDEQNEIIASARTCSIVEQDSTFKTESTLSLQKYLINQVF